MTWPCFTRSPTSTLISLTYPATFACRSISWKGRNSAASVSPWDRSFRSTLATATVTALSATAFASDSLLSLTGSDRAIREQEERAKLSDKQRARYLVFPGRFYSLGGGRPRGEDERPAPPDGYREG